MSVGSTAESSMQPVAIIGAGLDLGAGAPRGRHGPFGDPVRRACRSGSRASAGRASTGATSRPVSPRRPRSVTRRPAISVRSCAPAARSPARVADARTAGHVPLVLGGDHSVAMGTLGGMAKVHGPGGVLWIDAHADMNRPGNLAERQRPRHAARCSARRRRRRVRDRRLADPVGGAGRDRRRAVDRRGRARA